MSSSPTLQEFCAARGLRAPRGLAEALRSKAAEALRGLGVTVYRVEGVEEDSLAAALERLDSAYHVAPASYLPIVQVDDMSLACAVCGYLDDETPDGGEGDAASLVVRWHLGEIDARHQGELLDTDAVAYISSVREELQDRTFALRQMERAAERFKAQFTDQERQPQAKDERPVQLACQNVIVGLATLQHDRHRDALRVGAFATCEAPHLATQEGVRALLAMIFCDAFQAGGTMEIRFGSWKNERPVPTAVRRFARTRDIVAGAEETCSISPAEARALFWAVTPMTGDLSLRASGLIDRGMLNPERLCFVLMSGIWSQLELDYLAATSSRLQSVLGGGAGVEGRGERLVEMESCRAALMIAMLHRRLNQVDGVAGTGEGVRIFDDTSRDITWSVLDEEGAVWFDCNEAPHAWLRSVKTVKRRTGGMLVVPRALSTPADIETLRNLQEKNPDVAVFLVTPADMSVLVPDDAPTLVCPDRLAQLDFEIERRLTRARVGRA